MQAESLDPQNVLAAYACGAFPMTDADGVTRWYTADPRGILPLDQFHVPRTLRQVIRQGRFEVRFNHDFAGVMTECMRVPRRHEHGTWISPVLIEAYRRLHALGHAHSVEAWRNGRLVGGLYGVSLGAAFFGESMFHRERDASKVALVYLVERLRERGFELLDTQTVTPHLRRFGCIEITAEEYLRRLRRALTRECRFD
ncbi:MAG: leucyl/phenylalanyl-tRNA--protein transferase [Phycisphaerae bacterium]|nr:leucyl/phenylalanyl-tRNA--protein transferase [Phycisphaerae bacterium]MDW8263396.1 leucyl/phenylalanyl-tRNA--protein transferase [Phycisphaerales bacterium]